MGWKLVSAAYCETKATIELQMTKIKLDEIASAIDRPNIRTISGTSTTPPPNPVIAVSTPDITPTIATPITEDVGGFNSRSGS